MTPILRKAYGTETAIGQYLLVAPGAADFNVRLATASTDKLMGTSGRMGAAVVGDRIEVTRLGIDEVMYGGTVAAGDALTCDALGRAVTAAPGAGVNARIVGYAEVAGVLGDIGKVFIAPGTVQG